MKIHLSRFVSTDVRSNLQRMEAECRQAAGADLVVFPESFLHGYTRPSDPAHFRQRFRTLSGDLPGTAFLFGSFSEEGRNRLTLWKGGEERARYDKVHLFEPNGEPDLWAPGDRYVALRLGSWTLGLVNCNDLRFPEQARALRIQGGCDLLVAVAWWPWRRASAWELLLRARAVENGIFTAGCCISASRHPGEDFDGAGNHVFDPLGEPVPTADDHTYDLDRARLGAVLVDPGNAWRDITRVDVLSFRSPCQGVADPLHEGRAIAVQEALGAVPEPGGGGTVEDVVVAPVDGDEVVEEVVAHVQARHGAARVVGGLGSGGGAGDGEREHQGEHGASLQCRG
jgi:predicted amidohydrolase